MNLIGRWVIGVLLLATLAACQSPETNPDGSTGSSGVAANSTPVATATPTPGTTSVSSTTPTATTRPTATTTSTSTTASTTTTTSASTGASATTTTGASTSGSSPTIVDAPVPPAAPENVAATAGNRVVTISWSVSAGAQSYNVQRGTVSSGPYTKLAAPTGPSYTDSTVTNSTRYYYVVSAANAAGHSADSAEVSATPTAPTAPSSPPTKTSTSTVGVSRPSYNTGTGLFVFNGVLYDSSGIPFVIQGLNIDDATSLSVSAAGMAAANANAVRYNVYQVFNLSTMVTAANTYINNQQVPILTVQNVVGPSDDKLSGDASVTDLQNVVTQWNNSFASLSTASLQKHMILNIANEWGPAGSTTWRDAYIAAVTSLRNAGYTCPLMIDTGGYGQDAGDLLNYAAAVFNADPQKNIIFTIHLYNSAAGALGGSPNLLQQLAALSVSDGMVFAVMEFGPAESVQNATNVTAAQVINAANASGLGWAAWGWDDPVYALPGDPYQMTVTQGYFTGSPATAGSSSQLTAYGQQVVPFFATSAKETDFP